MTRILAGVAVLLVVAQAPAEYRTVLVQVKRSPEKKTTVTIHSDEKKEQMSGAPVEDALKVLGQMKGWGSQVGVYVTAERAIAGADLKKLLSAVLDNPRLELMYFGPDVPAVVANHFLKTAEKPMPPAKKQMNESIVGQWVSDDADRVPLEFGGDGSISLGLFQLDWKWQMAKGTYVIGDGGKVKYKAKLGAHAISGQFTMKDGFLTLPTGSNAETKWKKVAQPAAPQRDPEEAFAKACALVAVLEGKHDLLKGVSKVKATIQRDENKRLTSGQLAFANNTTAPGKNEAKAKDESKPFLFVSVELWSGRSQAPPANLYEFQWQGQTYQIWIRVYGSDAELVKMVRKLVDERLREPLPAGASSSARWPGARSSLQALAPETVAVLVAVAKEKAEIHTRRAAHLSTQTAIAKGDVIEGGGFVFYAECRQRFHVTEILHGPGKVGDRVLAYSFVEKTEGFPLPAVQEPIPVAVSLIILLGEKGNLLKALPDTEEHRKAVLTVLSQQKGKGS
jgi:hypothetical protein